MTKKSLDKVKTKSFVEDEKYWERGKNNND